MRFDEIKQRLDPKCWKGYRKSGTKVKDGVRVNNCVKIKDSITYEDAFSGLNPNSTIYVDMDGVLADFFGDWKKLVGKDWRELDKDEVDPALKKIRDSDDFWLKLPLTSNAKNLLSLIKKVKGDYKILSSPLAGDPNAEPHKREWVEKNLDFFPPSEVIITTNKEKYATNPDGTPNILIDDYGVNIDKWEGAGGIGFKHKDHKFERTADKLKAELADSKNYFIDSIRSFIVENKLLDKPTLSVDELAKKHNKSKEYIQKQLAAGIKIELEHTSKKDVAREIALDHLAEKPDYYERLKAVEEHIVKVKGGYRLVSKKSGKNLGTYPTKAGAEKRERQVQYFKHKG